MHAVTMVHGRVGVPAELTFLQMRECFSSASGRKRRPQDSHWTRSPCARKGRSQREVRDGVRCIASVHDTACTDGGRRTASSMPCLHKTALVGACLGAANPVY